jgi:hypothetical protein
MLKTLCTLLLTFVLSITTALADSPVTATEVAKAYQSEAIVKKAASDKLSDEVIKYLYDEKNPIDIKMAAIYSIGGDINGTDNATRVLEYVYKKGKYSGEADFLERGKAHELLCAAYLKAFDNYFDVNPAVIYADRAVAKMPQSFTYSIITGLIYAQTLFEIDWCQVYHTTEEIALNTDLTMDMREESVNAIFEYMGLYASYCTEEAAEEYEYYSPLTTTPFAGAYSEERLIKSALESSGELTTEMALYLLNDKYPLGNKIALINALSFNYEGNNAVEYANALWEKKGYMDEEDFRVRATADELLCLAYLTAFENASNVGEALVYAELAYMRKKDSYLVQVIRMIIRAQDSMNRYEYCTIYTLFDKTRAAKVLKKDIKPEAWEIIETYLSQYESYCNEDVENVEEIGE